MEDRAELVGVAFVEAVEIVLDDGRFVILMVAALGAFASIAAIVLELGASHHSAPAMALATVTIALSWAAVHTIFALHYAHEFYRGAKPGGLLFPSGEKHENADYWDFVYFSFVFNTALVALMVNIAASAI